MRINKRTYFMSEVKDVRESKWAVPFNKVLIKNNYLFTEA